MSKRKYALGAMLALTLGTIDVAHSAVIELNGIKATVGENSFLLQVTVDGMAFCERAEIYVVKPRWAGTYYGAPEDAKLKDTVTTGTLVGGGLFAQFEFTDTQNGVMCGNHRVEISPDRRMRLSIDAENTSSCQAWLEYAACNMVPSWFAGQKVKVTMPDGKEYRKTFPFSMMTVDRQKSEIGTGFAKVVADTRSGPITFTFSGNAPYKMLDYRMRTYLEDRSQIWLGVNSVEFPPQAHKQTSMEIQFPQPTAAAVADDDVSVSSTMELGQSLRPDQIPDRVIPTPKNVNWKKSNLPISKSEYASYNCPDAANALNSLSTLLAGKVGVTAGSAVVLPDAVIKARIVPEKHMKPEGYHIKVDNKLALIEAQTTIGLLHAMRTFAQLVRVDETGKQWSVRQCEITDWPAMPIRAVEFFTGTDAGDDQARIVDRLMGRLKYNMLIHHAVGGEWLSRPDLISTGILMKKTEMAKVREACRQQAVEYVPYLPSYGLSAWFRLPTTHPKSEKMELSRWNDPEELDALHSIFEECIAETHPRYIHISHDELFGATDEEVLGSINYWNQWLKERGIRTMIWSDMFLTKGDAPDACNAPSAEIAKKRRDALPRDVIVTAWHYDAGKPSDFKSLSIFNDEGFDTLGASWTNPQNAVALGKAVAKELPGSQTHKERNPDGSKRGATYGQICTTWAGWNFDRASMDAGLRQLANYVLTAESAWVGGYDESGQVPFDVLAEFYKIWMEEKLPSGASDGWTVDLNSVANLPLSGKNWLGYAAGENMSALPTGKQWLNRFKFDIPEGKAVLMAGQDLGTEVKGHTSVDVSVERKASSLVFAVAATGGYHEDFPIARTIVTYEDGTTEAFPWRLTLNVFSMDDGRSRFNTPVLWQGKTKAGCPMYLHSYVWNNPNPDKTIKSVKTVSTNQASALMLFGLTGVDVAKKK